MEILTQSQNEAQEAAGNVLQDMPVVVNDSSGRLCLLIKHLPFDLDRFIFHGIAEKSEFHVLTSGQERELAGICERERLTITYRIHRIEYMGKVAAITYPQISSPAFGTQISMVPWFMQIGRPYPIYANIYGCWHYLESGKKSMQESAEAVAKVFGIGSFNKSTVSRNLKEMDRLYGALRIDMPLSAEERETPPFERLALLVPKLLNPRETAAELDGSRGAATPSPSRRARAAGSCGEAAHAALRAIPRRLSEVIKGKSTAPQARRDARKRPARRRGGGAKKRRPALQFAKPQEIARARVEFIAACRCIVMAAAVKYRSAML